MSFEMRLPYAAHEGFVVYKKEEEEGGLQEQEMEGSWKDPWAVLVLDHQLGLVTSGVLGMEQGL